MREKYTNIPHVEMGGPVLQLNMYVNRETALF